MRTTGFKRQRAEFQDLLYQAYRRAGSQTSDQGTHGAGRHRDRLGRQDRRHPAHDEPGQRRRRPRRNSTSPSAAKASSWSSCPTAAPPTPATARSSATPTASSSTSTATRSQPGITIPDDANSVSISADGIVQAYLGTDTAPTQLGQIQLARFVNKAGLESIGDNLFVETAASGPAQLGVPNADGMGNVLQGYLESANVNSVTEIADLIAAQRAYEMNARVISGADEMLQATSQLR